MWEQHRLRIRRHPRFPTHRRVKRRRVDIQQNQVCATAVEPIRRQVHLLKRREMDEWGLIGRTARFGANPAPDAGPRPLLRPAQVRQDGRGGHGSQFARTAAEIREKRHTS